MGVFDPHVPVMAGGPSSAYGFPWIIKVDSALCPAGRFICLVLVCELHDHLPASIFNWNMEQRKPGTKWPAS